MCEYDALPEIGHACGHNLIAQVGIGAGVGVKTALERAGVTSARVTVLGCPAEESGGGKVDLIRAGAFDDVDVAMMCHPGFFNAPSTIILAMQECVIVALMLFKFMSRSHSGSCISRVFVTFTGRATHAAGSPWEGVNALDAAVQAYTSVSCMRQHMRPDWRVHGLYNN